MVWLLGENVSKCGGTKAFLQIIVEKWKRFRKYQSSSKHFLKRFNSKENVSKCGGTKAFLQVIVKTWIFVACNIQQIQTCLILLRIGGNKIYRQKCCKQNNFAMGEAETLSCDLQKTFCCSCKWKYSRVREA